MILRLRDKYGRFLVLLVALVAYLVLYPLLEHKDNRVILLVLTLGIPVAGVYAVSARRRDLIIATVLALPLVADYLTPNVQWPLVLSIGFPLLLYVFVLVTVLGAVLGSKQVTLDTLFGAAAGYLLMGLTWATAYSWIERSSPGSFVINSANDLGEMGLQWFDAIHFSYVTLTTLGYGEITPLSSLARSLSFLEAAAGVLYIAFLVARLLSAYMTKEELEALRG
jgi:hypothetical protein